MEKGKIIEQIKDLVTEKIDLDINYDDFERNLLDIGFNSLTFIKLLVLIEDIFDVEFEEEQIDFNVTKCLNNIVEFILDRGVMYVN